jgi:hypothetical protein
MSIAALWGLGQHRLASTSSIPRPARDEPSQKQSQDRHHSQNSACPQPSGMLGARTPPRYAQRPKIRCRDTNKDVSKQTSEVDAEPDQRVRLGNNTSSYSILRFSRDTHGMESRGDSTEEKGSRAESVVSWNVHTIGSPVVWYATCVSCAWWFSLRSISFTANRRLGNMDKRATACGPPNPIEENTKAKTRYVE